MRCKLVDLEVGLNVFYCQSRENMKYYVCMICLVLLSCHNIEKNVSGFEVDVMMNVDSSSINDVFSHISIIPLETKDDCLISSAKKIMCDSSSIYVFDQKNQQIYVFDGSGTFQTKLDKQGDGPDCYANLEDFNVDFKTNNISVISSYGQYRMYNSNREMILSARIPYQAIHYFYPLSSDLIALYTYINDGCVLIYSLNANKIVKNYVMSKDFVTLKTPYNSIQSPFSSYCGRLYFLASDQKKIYRILEDGNMECLYSFDFLENDYDVMSLPEDENNSFYISENINLDKIYCLSDFSETEKWYVLYFMYRHSLNMLFISKNDMSRRVLYNKKSKIHIYYPFYIDDSSLNSIVMVSDLKQIVKREWLSAKDWKMINDLPVDANPVIIKYHFKK